MAFNDAPPPKPPDLTARVLEGVVEFQLFPREAREDSDFGILKVFDMNTGQEAILKGNVGMWNRRSGFRAEGVWGYDFKRGWQFEVNSEGGIEPTSITVDDDGNIEWPDYDQLVEWAEEQGIELSEQMAGRGAARWGEEAAAKLEENPWALCDLGLPFAEVDPVVADFAPKKMDPRRTVAALGQVLLDAQEEGDTYVPRAELAARLKETMGLSPQARMGSSVETALESLADSEIVTVTDQGVYRTETFEAETDVARMLVERANAPVDDVDEETALAAATTPGFELTDEQRQAVLSLHRAKIAVITGGPGVGKTATLSGGIKSLSAVGTSFVLCSPTGKAAKRMTEATGHEASTIHSLLGWDYIQGLKAEPNEIEAKVIIVDEASMLDLNLAQKLLSALRPDQRLVLVGDVDQLPAVGMGNVFHDVIDAGCGDITRLTKTFRQGAGSLLLTNAQRVRDGVEPLWTTQEAEKAVGPVLEDFAHIETTGPRATADAVFDYSQSHPDSLVVSPTRSGICGVHSLNDMFQERLNPGGTKVLETEHYSLKTGDKILVTKNQKKLGIVNGDIGELIGSDGEFITLKVDGSPVQLEVGKAQDMLELGYVLTIHKSQGSQAGQVICPMQPGGASDRMLSRNLIYTAWTRGQQSCVVIGPKKVVRQALKINGTDRATALRSMIREFDSPGHEQTRPGLATLETGPDLDGQDPDGLGLAADSL